MKPIKLKENEDIFGGAIFSAIYLTIGAIMFIGIAVKVYFAEQAKVKLPFGFEIDFSGSNDQPLPGGSANTEAYNSNKFSSASKTYIADSGSMLTKWG